MASAGSVTLQVKPEMDHDAWQALVTAVADEVENRRHATACACPCHDAQKAGAR